MKKRFSEEQIIEVLKAADVGIKVPELCRKYGISGATYYKWKAKFGGMEVSDAKRLRSLEDENRRLKGILAQVLLEKNAIEEVLQKKW